MTQDPGARGPSRPCMPNHFQPREEGGIFPQPNQPRKENKSVQPPMRRVPWEYNQENPPKKKGQTVSDLRRALGGGGCIAASPLVHTKHKKTTCISSSLPMPQKMQIATIPPRVPAVVRPKKDYRLAVPRVCCPKKPRKINARLLKTSDKGN